MGKTVIFDFDGVIHSYTSGWKGIDVIPDEPVYGIRKAIDFLRNEYGYKVVVVSTRCAEARGIKAIREWLEKYDISVDGVQATKPPAMVSVDDRCICFDGDTSQLVGKIREFEKYSRGYRVGVLSPGEARPKYFCKWPSDVEELAKEVDKAVRQVIEIAASMDPTDVRLHFPEWEYLSEIKRETRRIIARYLIDQFNIEYEPYRAKQVKKQELLDSGDCAAAELKC